MKVHQQKVQNQQNQQNQQQNTQNNTTQLKNHSLEGTQQDELIQMMCDCHQNEELHQFKNKMPHYPQIKAQSDIMQMMHNSSSVQELRQFKAMMYNSPKIQQEGEFIQRMQKNALQNGFLAQLKAIGQQNQPIQKMPTEEEEILQGKFNEPVQKMSDAVSRHPDSYRESAVNRTGLPDNLKTGIENLSGYSMDDVKVHYNSSKPAQLQAHAYAQGTDIHLAPGQEKHLPHEAWHVVQQKQGRVKPTIQMKGGVNVNDDVGLEREADVMGEKAMQFKGRPVNIMIGKKNEDNKQLMQRKRGTVQLKLAGKGFLTHIQSMNGISLNRLIKLLNLLQNSNGTKRDIISQLVTSLKELYLYKNSRCLVNSTISPIELKRKEIETIKDRLEKIDETSGKKDIKDTNYFCRILDFVGDWLLQYGLLLKSNRNINADTKIFTKYSFKLPNLPKKKSRLNEETDWLDKFERLSEHLNKFYSSDEEDWKLDTKEERNEVIEALEFILNLINDTENGTKKGNKHMNADTLVTTGYEFTAATMGEYFTEPLKNFPIIGPLVNIGWTIIRQLIGEPSDNSALLQKLKYIFNTILLRMQKQQWSAINDLETRVARLEEHNKTPYLKNRGNKEKRMNFEPNAITKTWYHKSPWYTYVSNLANPEPKIDIKVNTGLEIIKLEYEKRKKVDSYWSLAKHKEENGKIEYIIIDKDYVDMMQNMKQNMKLYSHQEWAKRNKGQAMYGDSDGNNCLIYALAFSLRKEYASKKYVDQIRDSINGNHLGAESKGPLAPTENIINHISQLILSIDGECPTTNIQVTPIQVVVETAVKEVKTVHIGKKGRTVNIFHDGSHYWWLKTN